MKSTVNLISLWLDWTIGFRLRMATQRAQGAFLIFDRYHADLISNPKQYQYGGSSWLARLVSTTLPQPDGIIQIKTDASEALSCKDSIHLVIDHSLSESEVIEEIVSFISEAIGKYSRKSINFPS